MEEKLRKIKEMHEDINEYEQSTTYIDIILKIEFLNYIKMEESRLHQLDNAIKKSIELKECLKLVLEDSLKICDDKEVKKIKNDIENIRGDIVLFKKQLIKNEEELNDAKQGIIVYKEKIKMAKRELETNSFI